MGLVWYTITQQEWLTINKKDWNLAKVLENGKLELVFGGLHN
jgi:hypothetical protein